MRVLIPLPDRDFDVTEVSVPWHVLTRTGHEVVFATERGTAASPDPLLVSGLSARLLVAPEVREIHRELSRAPEYTKPIAWDDIVPEHYDGLLLPGGFTPGVRQYVEGTVLRRKVAQYWALNRPVGAICHGVLLLARTIDPATGRSVIAGKRTTCLPKHMERGGYLLLTPWRRIPHFQTYRVCEQDEVASVLNDPAQLALGPLLPRRGQASDERRGFVVQDGKYLSARYPGDAYLFALRFEQMLR
ncbi:hypothetical protein GCM10012275_51480 [Longimycelium tulufanense]|uniref:Thiamine biosynthesis protein ThiJ n=1 Tax=Longimycelium tulufanense TaxID=907463 RepID=A0A8J3CJ57_9PSEU|nr:type 1 glutamine amidotransferase domain-containing protein [Longimycelium tulufanense]GGM74479.1 hypothetical protein GCM10012275_51480 [Longimycelium tulufanense]